MKSFSKTAEKPQAEGGLYRQLFASPKWQQANTVGLTLSFPFEIDTAPIIQRAWAENKNVGLARVDAPGKMNFYSYQQNDELLPSKFGIPEPNPTTAPLLSAGQLDLILVPGIVFNRSNQRIGFGGGFYDRYLAPYKGATIALAFSFQLRDDWEAGAHDLPVSQVIVN